jgi:ribosome-binding protein aMBF1 (putative translation factor)
MGERVNDEQWKPQGHSVRAMAESIRAGRLRWLCPDETNAIEESNFGLALRALRQRAGLSQRELAERIGTTQSAIARMEKGKTEPRFWTLGKLAEALNRDLHVHVSAVDHP